MVQTIIITRGEGKTPLPAAEKLEEMAKLKATICLFLSVQIAQKVQDQLMTHFEAVELGIVASQGNELSCLEWFLREVHYCGVFR